MHTKRDQKMERKGTKKVNSWNRSWLTSALIRRATDDLSLSIRLIWLFVWMRSLAWWFFSSSLFGMLLAPFAVGRSTKSKKCKCYKVHGIIDYLQSTKKRNVHITKPKQSNFDCCLSHFILNLHSWPLYLLLPLIQLPDISPLVSFRFDSFAFFCYCHSMGWLCDAAVDLYIISCDGIALCVQCTSKARERTLQ